MLSRFLAKHLYRDNRDSSVAMALVPPLPQSDMDNERSSRRVRAGLRVGSPHRRDGEATR